MRRRGEQEGREEKSGEQGGAPRHRVSAHLGTGRGRRREAGRPALLEGAVLSVGE